MTPCAGKWICGRASVHVGSLVTRGTDSEEVVSMVLEVLTQYWVVIWGEITFMLGVAREGCENDIRIHRTSGT